MKIRVFTVLFLVIAAALTLTCKGQVVGEASPPQDWFLVVYVAELTGPTSVNCELGKGAHYETCYEYPNWADQPKHYFNSPAQIGRYADFIEGRCQRVVDVNDFQVFGGNTWNQILYETEAVGGQCFFIVSKDAKQSGALRYDQFLEILDARFADAGTDGELDTHDSGLEEAADTDMPDTALPDTAEEAPAEDVEDGSPDEVQAPKEG